jgi:5-oxoprolinase (ATP-hydrolysing)/N-methylhydantoinase B
MRFAEKGYYIEEYVKCANCGMLIYGEALTGERGGRPAVLCSDWCRDWLTLRATWAEEPPESDK